MKSSPYGPLVRMLVRLFVVGGPLRWLFGAALLGVIAVSLWRPELLPDNARRPSGESSRPNSQSPFGKDASFEGDSPLEEDSSSRAEDPFADAEVERGRLESADDRAAPAGDSASVAQPENSKATGDGLTRLPGGVLRSPAGLLYTRGSAEGHRLDHVLAHGIDQRSRPGYHGVFAEADRQMIVQLLDEAYLQAMKGTRSRRRVEDGRTIYTVDMGRDIGYIGGELGNRKGRPRTQHIRLVLEDQRVITAYPIIP